MLFAHLSDIHLGFQKHESLQQTEQDVFEKALDECISRKVDFILISGDMFHVNIPEMRVQKFAFAKFRQVHEAEIPVYVVYGSHDFSPVSNSVIDLLVAIGYISKVTKVKDSDDEKIVLDFLVDLKTGAKIYGLSGLKMGKDREYYENLDRASLEAESGFKIFLFHGGISDMKTESGIDGDHMPLSLLPKGFSYYAGGHMHKFNHQSFDGYSHVVYPGTPFAGFHSDLEENSKGQKRGLVLVEFEDEIKDVSFIELENTEYEIIEIDANNRKTDSINKELLEKTQEIDPGNKIVIIKIGGEMTSGKTSDVDISAIRESLYQRKASAVEISKSRLTSLEYSITEAKGENKVEIEANVFSENIGQLRFKQKNLIGDAGVALAKKLLSKLGQAGLENEKKADYASRIKQDAIGVLGLKIDDS